MHREIQIKQFPIVTTHWWPKTRNERFVWENQQYLYRFLPLVHNHVQVIWVHTHIRCVTCVCVCVTCVCVCVTRVCVCVTCVCVCDVCVCVWHVCVCVWRVCVCVCALWLVGVNAWRRACLKRGADATFQAPTEASANQIASCKYQRSMWLVVVTMTAHQHHASDTPSVKRWRRRPVWMQREPERAHTRHTHTHTRHTPDVCALRSLGHGCVQEVKNDINTVCFLTQTARFVS